MGEEERWPCFKVQMKNFEKSRDRWPYTHLFKAHTRSEECIKKTTNWWTRPWTIAEQFSVDLKNFLSVSSYQSHQSYPGPPTYFPRGNNHDFIMRPWSVFSHHLYERSILIYGYDILVDLRMQRLFVSTSLKDHNDDYKKRRYWKDFTINEYRDQNFLFWKKYGMLHKLYDFFIHGLPTFVRTDTY